MKILIELPTWLGDAVMATPSIENLSNYFNNCEITLIGSTITINALKNHPKVKVSLDLFYFGVIFFRKEQAKEHFKIRV